MKPLNIIVTLLVYMQIGNAYEIVCPKIPYTAISVEIIPKVSFNKKTALYKYEYIFKNDISSQLPIELLRMSTNQNVQSAKATHHWDVSFDNIDIEMLWSAMPDPELDSLISPGKSISGFEFESPNPPGPIKYAVGGWKDILVRSNFPRIIFAPGEKEKYAHDEIEANCPGENFEDRLAEVIGITTGPIRPDTIIGKLRLRKINEKKWHGKHDEKNPTMEISSLDTGKIQLMLFDDKDIDVSKIDLASIKFGPGEAMPVKTEFTQYVDDEKDSEIVDHLKKHNKSHLLMEFNFAALKVECDIDHALFLNAKLGDKKLFGAVKIKPASCRDVHKIKTEKDKKNKIKKEKDQNR